MAMILNILTREPDAMVVEALSAQRKCEGKRVEIFDLTVAEPDYAGLVALLFEADSVAVW